MASDAWFSEDDGSGEDVAQGYVCDPGVESSSGIDVEFPVDHYTSVEGELLCRWMRTVVGQDGREVGCENGSSMTVAVPEDCVERMTSFTSCDVPTCLLEFCNEAARRDPCDPAPVECLSLDDCS